MIHTVHSFVHGCAQVTKVAWRGVVMVALVHGGIAHAGTDPVPLWVQHSATSMGNMGQCAVRLTFDSQDQEVKGLLLKLAAVDAKGTVQARGEMAVPDFGQTSAQRHAEGYWSNAALCEDGLTLRIERASARLLGKPFDLLARQLLEVDEFKPMPIQVGMPRAAKR